jgi:two-component sensor histidine kinase
MERTVPICRRLARLWLDSEQIHDENTRYIILLVTSELITNAIQHSVSERIVGRLWRTGSVLFIEIRDQGGTSSVPRVDRVDESRDHGRGLELVAKLVRGWGRQFGADGSCAVWAAVLLTSGARSEMNGNN